MAEAVITTPPTSTRSFSLVAILISAATALFLIQLAIGTTFYFSALIYTSFLVSILTLRIIGFTSIAGILLSFFVLRYLVFSQVIKTLYGQPGHTNLAAPETTVAVLLVGLISMCAAAIIVSRLIGEKQFVSFNPEPSTLVHVRNICFGMGILTVLLASSFSFSESGDAQYGGIVGIAKQVSSISYFAVMAETWRVLMLTNGRRSLSRYLPIMLGILFVIGIASNSKTAILFPFMAYLLASIAYRRGISKQQLALVAAGVVGFTLVIYPLIHVMRGISERSGSLIELSTISEFVTKSISNPNYFYDQWDSLKAVPDDSVYAQGLHYLGSSDELLSRFLLIANTDIIVNAVNNDGMYGPGLIIAGINSSIPHFITPNKQQGSMGDVVTWYYGLRTWGLVGYPANGLFADCYAALGWLGVVIIPFSILIFYFSELQLTGTRFAGNLVGAFFVLITLNSFVEANIQQFISTVVRGLPQYFFLILAIFYSVDILLGRRRSRGQG